MLFDDPGAEEESEAEGNPLSADFGSLELELMERRFDLLFGKDASSQTLKNHFPQRLGVLRLAALADDREGSFAHLDVDRRIGLGAEPRSQKGFLQKASVGIHQKGVEQAEGEDLLLIGEGRREPGKGDLGLFFHRLRLGDRVSSRGVDGRRETALQRQGGEGSDLLDSAQSMGEEEIEMLGQREIAVEEEEAAGRVVESLVEFSQFFVGQSGNFLRISS